MSGARGNTNALKHGYYAREEREARARVRALLGEARAALAEARAYLRRGEGMQKIEERFAEFLEELGIAVGAEAADAPEPAWIKALAELSAEPSADSPDLPLTPGGGVGQNPSGNGRSGR